MHSQFFPQKSVPEGWQYCMWGNLSALCCPSMDTVEPQGEEEANLTADCGVRIQVWGFQALGEATVLS